MMRHNALWRRVWDSRRPAGGFNRLLENLPPVLPTKTSGLSGGKTSRDHQQFRGHVWEVENVRGTALDAPVGL